MKRVVILSFLIFSILIIAPILNAQTIDNLGTFRTSSVVDLKQVCGNSTRACSFCNISSVTDPNSTTLITDVVMTKRNVDFNYTLLPTQTIQVGQYIVNGLCTAGTEHEVWAYTFDVTPTGYKQDTAKAIFYLILSFGVFLAFMISLYFNLTISSKNVRNDENVIVAVSKVKYLKFMLILVTYPLGLWLLNIFVTISNSFVGVTVFSGFFSFIFLWLVRLSFPLFVFVFVVILFNVVRDSNITKMVDKFGSA